MPKKSKLTPKQKKFVKAKAEGKSHAKAYEEAGYSTNSSKDVIRANAQNLMKKDKIQEAIDKALDYHGATAEFAVGRLKAVAEQEDQWGAARQASKDIIELHGWNKSTKPHVTIQLESKFFSQAREPQDVIDIED